MDIIDQLKHILTLKLQVESLNEKSKSLSAEMRSQFKALVERLAAGETTGCSVGDYAILTYGVDWQEFATIVYDLNTRIERSQGQYVLVAKWEDGACSTQAPSYKYTALLLGILNDTSLRLSPLEYVCEIPTSSYAAYDPTWISCFQKRISMTELMREREFLRLLKKTLHKNQDISILEIAVGDREVHE